MSRDNSGDIRGVLDVILFSLLSSKRQGRCRFEKGDSQRGQRQLLEWCQSHGISLSAGLSPQGSSLLFQPALRLFCLLSG